MTDYVIPRANAPIAGQEAPTLQWYNYLLNLGNTSTASSSALLQDVTIISEKLGSPDGTPENIPPLTSITDIQGLDSVFVTGDNIKQVNLVNDVLGAQPVSFYGANISGIKGWNLVSSAFANSGDIEKSVSGGIVSFDLVQISAIALTALSGTSVVALDGMGNAYYPDLSVPSDVARIVGVTMGAAAMGAIIQITTSHDFTESAWGWSPGRIYCTTTGGQLTQTPPTSPSAIVEIARVISPTTIRVGIQPAILI